MRGHLIGTQKEPRRATLFAEVDLGVEQLAHAALRCINGLQVVGQGVKLLIDDVLHLFKTHPVSAEDVQRVSGGVGVEPVFGGHCALLRT